MHTYIAAVRFLLPNGSIVVEFQLIDAYILHKQFLMQNDQILRRLTTQVILLLSTFSHLLEDEYRDVKGIWLSDVLLLIHLL